MSVAYEPRSFLHEGAYPPIGDEHDHGAAHRYTDSDVEHLAHYSAEAPGMLQDGRVVLDEQGMLHDPSHEHPEGARMDLSTADFAPPLDVSMPPAPDVSMPPPDASMPPPDEPMPAPEMAPAPPVPDTQQPPPSDEPAQSSSDPKLSTYEVEEPERPPAIPESDGKYHCRWEGCKAAVKIFTRACEWKKHNDKHTRPYKCRVEGCDHPQGFTYGGGLTRHMKEVHRMHDGKPGTGLHCPHPTCKRHQGNPFTRRENLNEHLRRVHTTPDEVSAASASSSPEGGGGGGGGAGGKRKRGSSASAVSADEVTELRNEIKRVRLENEKLKAAIARQGEDSLTMIAQIAELRNVLNIGDGLGAHGLGAPTAQMI